MKNFYLRATNDRGTSYSAISGNSIHGRLDVILNQLDGGASVSSVKINCYEEEGLLHTVVTVSGHKPITFTSTRR